LRNCSLPLLYYAFPLQSTAEHAGLDGQAWPIRADWRRAGGGAEGCKIIKIINIAGVVRIAGQVGLRVGAANPKHFGEFWSIVV
jgi:hypothetical protein